MKLRKYIESDANEIINWIHSEREFRLWSADRYDSYPFTAEDINTNYTYCSKNSSFYPMTLIDDEKIIGHLIFRKTDENKDIIRLGFIIVNSNLRGNGYGRILMEEAIRYAKNTLNASEINLGVFICNESAFKCYSSVGFKVVKLQENAYSFYDENWDCAEMILQY